MKTPVTLHIQFENRQTNTLNYSPIQIIPEELTWNDFQVMMKILSDQLYVHISYSDEEDDPIIIESQEELNEAFRVARRNSDTLFVHVVSDGVRFSSDSEMEAANVYSASVNSAQMNSSQVNLAQMNSAQVNLSQMNSAQVNSAQVNSAQLNSAQVNSAQLNSAQLNSAQLNSAQLNISQNVNESQSPKSLYPSLPDMQLADDRVVCKICNKSIVGVRYKCGYCVNFDLCELCEAKPGSHDPSHILLKIKFSFTCFQDPMLLPTNSGSLYSAYNPHCLGAALSHGMEYAKSLSEMVDFHEPLGSVIASDTMASQLDNSAVTFPSNRPIAACETLAPKVICDRRANANANATPPPICESKASLEENITSAESMRASLDRNATPAVSVTGVVGNQNKLRDDTLVNNGSACNTQSNNTSTYTDVSAYNVPSTMKKPVTCNLNQVDSNSLVILGSPAESASNSTAALASNQLRNQHSVSGSLSKDDVRDVNIIECDSKSADLASKHLSHQIQRDNESKVSPAEIQWPSVVTLEDELHNLAKDKSGNKFDNFERISRYASGAGVTNLDSLVDREEWYIVPIPDCFDLSKPVSKTSASKIVVVRRRQQLNQANDVASSYANEAAQASSSNEAAKLSSHDKDAASASIMTAENLTEGSEAAAACLNLATELVSESKTVTVGYDDISAIDIEGSEAVTIARTNQVNAEANTDIDKAKFWADIANATAKAMANAATDRVVIATNAEESDATVNFQIASSRLEEIGDTPLVEGATIVPNIANVVVDANMQEILANNELSTANANVDEATAIVSIDATSQTSSAGNLTEKMVNIATHTAGVTGRATGRAIGATGRAIGVTGRAIGVAGKAVGVTGKAIGVAGKAVGLATGRAATSAFTSARDAYHNFQTRRHLAGRTVWFTPPNGVWVRHNNSWFYTESDWSPLAQQWTRSQPATDLNAQADSVDATIAEGVLSDTTAAASDATTAVSDATAAASDAKNSALQSLLDMGFTDIERNNEILRVYRNDLNATVQELLLTSSEWSVVH